MGHQGRGAERGGGRLFEPRVARILRWGGGGEGEREREEREGPRLSKQEVGFTLLAARDLLSKPADSWIVAFLPPPVPSSPLPLTYLLPLAYNHHITIMFTARRDSN